MCIIILNLVHIDMEIELFYYFSSAFPRVWWTVRVWGYDRIRMKYSVVVKTKVQNYLDIFFAKDVISIFHHCEIGTRYLDWRRLSFTRTSMRWKIIDVKMKLFSIRWTVLVISSCCLLFLPVIKFACAFIHPPTFTFVSNRAMKYHVNENFKVSYTKILLLFNLVHFSMISFSFH